MMCFLRRVSILVVVLVMPLSQPWLWSEKQMWWVEEFRVQYTEMLRYMDQTAWIIVTWTRATYTHFHDEWYVRIEVWCVNLCLLWRLSGSPPIYVCPPPEESLFFHSSRPQVKFLVAIPAKFCKILTAIQFDADLRLWSSTTLSGPWIFDCCVVCVASA